MEGLYIISPPVIQPMIPSPFIQANTKEIALATLFEVGAVIAFLCASLLVMWLLCLVMKRKEFTHNIPVILSATAVYAVLAMVTGGGVGIAAVKGILLLAVLAFASCSDLTSHTVDDYLWVMVLLIAFVNPTAGIGSMLLGTAIIFIPQMAVALIKPSRSIGGADIKMSTALGFALGFERGIAAFALGLVIAVIYTLIENKRHPEHKGGAFALLPFLSVGALVMYLI